MTEERTGNRKPDDAGTTVPGRGDDEQENREQIDKTGEPTTDALGNADGAS